MRTIFPTACTMPVNMAAKGNPKEIRSYCSHATPGGIDQRGLGPWRRGSRVRRRARGARTDPPFAPARVRHSDAARPDSAAVADRAAQAGRGKQAVQDRKSTRLNSSHGYISYAVFCLKKKKQNYFDGGGVWL